MSIGEEQSDSTVTAIAWSPRGLARHGRPALAVLTTNHLLSLWASAPAIEDHSTWKRVLVANDFSSNAPRICSMAWAPSLPPLKRNTARWQRKPGVQILAIALDSGGIQFLRISSPFTTESGEWQCERLCEMVSNSEDSWDTCSGLSDPISLTRRSRYSLFGSAMGTSHLIESINLSPWTVRDNVLETIVTFRARGGASHICAFSMDNEKTQGQIQLIE